MSRQSFRTGGILVALAFLTAVLFSPLAEAAPSDDVDALVKQLTDIETLAADFVQERRDAKGQVRRQSSGTFVLKRPGQFFWRYETPYVQELIANDGTLWVYEPDLRQASRSPLSATDGAPIAILTGERPVTELFHVRHLESEGGLDWFALRPRDEQGDFREVLLGVDERGIREMRFVDQLDQTTRVSFESRRFNQPVDESTFRFEAPEGVDVVEAREPPGIQ
ncbi:outer membrane lipoprotein chaperone LolA [Guyparkeria halophila]|uniref:Outer-membrane lipoprotein carrier protein n=1 Tax=Guyparkeria halophila TaxID=47960 RepID=A0ABZ0YTX9_9GAMM|nr:outer membrane lipoprotein chaperone LolA [Guyparkeria halophila]WQH15456.1 outer membrane lipoprotein chaperone LolA [Guyparkeria halophila]